MHAERPLTALERALSVFLCPRVASGRYQNASEVLREGLRLLERQESEDAARIAVRELADKGWADLASGRYDDIADDDLDDVIGRLGVHVATRAHPAG